MESTNSKRRVLYDDSTIMIKGRLEFFFTGECKAILVLDSEDFLAVMPPIAILHVDELIDV